MITIPEKAYTPKEVTVESDWSASSYWYEIAALIPGSEFILKGLHRHSLQGDSNIQKIFTSLGVQTSFSNKGVTIKQVDEPAKKLKYDFISEPDLAQTVATTCCLLNVPFEFTGLQTLKIKETDRINALINELAKMGFKLTTNNVDNLIWDGEKIEVENKDIFIKTYKDHRMAMAFAPAVLKGFDIIIEEPKVVSKSYPKYWDDLKAIGVEMTE